jgi:hypothetical protein
MVVGSLLMACQFVSTNMPQYSAWANALAGLLTAISTTVGLLSPAVGQQMSPAAVPAAGPAASATQLSMASMEARLEASAK